MLREAERTAAANVARAKGEAEALIARARGQSEPAVQRMLDRQLESERIRKWNGAYAPTIQAPNANIVGGSLTGK